MSEPLLSIRDLEIAFETQNGTVPAVRGVSFDLNAGDTLAIVGESGSGKSTTATSIINLLPGTGKVTAGSIKFDGKELTTMSRHDMENLRGREIGFVPQDPMSNLNPVWSIGFQVEEAVRANGIATGRKAVKARAIEVLKEAGLSDADRRMKQYPHQFSGGMRQRVLIGMGLAAQPKLLIADEPTSALDVTVQRVILDHLDSLTKELGTAVIFITHDLGLAAERAKNLVVMYKGRVVEAGPSIDILQHPQHPYTKRLVAAAPSLASRRIQSAEGALSDLTVAAPTGDVQIDLVAHAAERAELRAAAGARPTAISLQDVTKVYKIRQGSGRAIDFTAADSVTFDVKKGTTTAIVGESGSGKSTVAKMLLGLEPITRGSIFVDGKDMSTMNKKELFGLRRRMQPVFQDPYGSLNPLQSIGSIIAEPLNVHNVGTPKERRERVAELLDQVSLPRVLAGRYPNELSGGQRQRVAIARALALKPDIIVLDEAVSALDVLVQAQVLQLLAELQEELDLTYLFITHDLAVVRVIADNVCVMEKGKIIEAGTTDEVFQSPKTEYTRALLAAIPGAGIELGV